jgi:hypothetical protein
VKTAEEQRPEGKKKKKKRLGMAEEKMLQNKDKEPSPDISHQLL